MSKIADPDRNPAANVELRSFQGRQRKNLTFLTICIGTATLSILVLVVLLIAVFVQGSSGLAQAPTFRWEFPWIHHPFLVNPPSPEADEAGVGPALGGTFWVCLGCALFTLPLGVGAAIFLEEFKPKWTISRWIHGFIQLNISNLAGVPSVVYGIIGLTAFAAMFGLFNTDTPLEIGAEYFDQFATEGKDTYVLVPVEHRNSPPTRLITWHAEGEMTVPPEASVVRLQLNSAFYFDPWEYAKVLIDGVPADAKAKGGELTVDVSPGQHQWQLTLPGQEPLTVKIVPADEQDVRAPEGQLIVQSAGDIKFSVSQDHETKITDAVTPRKPHKKIKLNVIGAFDELPENEKELKYTIRSDSEGGRIADEHWYYLSLPFGRGVLTGSLTLMLVVLPIVIIASQESIRAVPNSLREGALGMGATPWQMVSRVTLPAAVPGIMTGSILAMSRAIGEAAPILMISGIVYITTVPGHMMDEFAVMPLQVYNWAGKPQVEFHDVAATGIIVLLVVLLFFNALAVFIRYKLHKPLS